MKQLIFSLVLAGCASAAPVLSEPAAPPVTTAAVIAAERAFAGRVGEVGWIPAFREFVEPGGQLAGPEGYSDAPASLAETPDDGNRSLFWWPAFAGISNGGDFGFTTGPVSFDEARTARGHYFTVWRRQADGSWKWLYDGGVGPIAEPNLIAPDAADVPSAPVVSGGVGQAEALAQVRALEAAGVGASQLAPDARVMRARETAGVGALAAVRLAQPAGARHEVLRVEASQSGDIVAVLGTAHWTREDGAEASGPYARVWHLRAEGWRVVYDQLITPRPAPPPAQ